MKTFVDAFRGSAFGFRQLVLAVLLAGLLTASVGAGVAAAAPSYIHSGEFGYETFSNPTRIAVDDATGKVLVVDSGNNRVKVFQGGTSETLLTTFGEGDLSSPYGIAVDQGNGDVYVTSGVLEVQKVTLAEAASGTFTLDLEGQTTDPIAFDADAAGVQAALVALSTVGAGNVTVRQSGSTYTVTFVGALAGDDLDAMTADSGGLVPVDAEPATATVQTLADGIAGKIVRYETDGALVPTYSEDPTYSSPAQGTGAGQVAFFSSPIAIDPASGDLVIADTGNLRVSRFDSSGAFQGSFDGTGSTAGAFTGLSDLALDGSGHVYVVADGTVETTFGAVSGRRAERFAADGTAEGSVGLGLDEAEAIAVDLDSGNVFVTTRGAFVAFGGEGLAALHVFDAGQQVAEVTYPNTDSKSTGEARAPGLAVAGGSSRLVYGLTAPLPEVSLGGTSLPWGSTSVQVFQKIFIPELVLDVPSQVEGTSAHLSGTVNPGGEADVKYHFEYSSDGGASWISTPDAAAGSGETAETVEADLAGLAPATEYQARLVATTDHADATSATQPFQTATTAPEVVTGKATDRTDSSATLRGSINPAGLQTTFYFEYGTTSGYGQRVPADHDLLAGAGAKARTVSETVTGLTPSTTYHYRLVAKNSAGETQGLDRTFATEAVGAEARSYEMVTPPYKGGAGLSLYNGGAAADGNAVVFGTLTPLPGAESAPQRPVNIAQRGPDGWSSTSLDLPQGIKSTLFIQTVLGVSGDLTKVLGISTRKLAPGAIEGDSNYYLRDTRTGEITTLATVPGSAVVESETGGIGTNFGIVVAATRDYSHILLRPYFAALLPGAPAKSLYEWDEGTLSLVSRDTNGDPLATGAGASAGISADGGVIAYRDGGASDLEAYLRDENGEIVSLSGVDAGNIVGVSDDGKYVFLEAGPPGEAFGWALKRYDVAAQQMTQIAPVTSGDSITTSRDGEYVYFHSQKDLAPGGSGPGEKVYFWHDGQIMLAVPGPQLASGFTISADGRYSVFNSQDQLTEYDPHSSSPACPSGSCAQTYRYDAVTDETLCVSCRPDGGEATGGAGEGTLLADGRVIFSSTDQLAIGDTNAARDVYLFDGAQVKLISPGSGPGDSFFRGASADGRDIFFSTNERLVGIDVDSQTDLYDARVGGGIAAQNPPPVTVNDVCEGENCRGPASAPPAGQSAGSNSFAGPGSPSHRKKHGKKHHHKKHHKKKHHKNHRHSHKRAATNGHGGGK